MSEYNPRVLARNLIRMGLSVIELHPGLKRPIGDGWTTRPCTTLEEADARWGAMPDAGVGVMTGQVSEVTVLDFDNKEDHRGWATAERILGPGWHQRVPWVLTASGTSAHVYVRYQPHWGSHSLLELGLDIQGDRRQVVAPGVVLSGREYVCQGPMGFLGVPELVEVTPEMDAAVMAILGERRMVEVRDLGDVVPEDLGDLWASAVVGKLRGKPAALWHHGDRQGDGSTAVFNVAVALAGMTNHDDSEWLVSPGQALALLMGNPHCAAVADKRRGGGDNSLDWMRRYNLPKTFGARAGTPGEHRIIEALRGEEDDTPGAGDGNMRVGGGEQLALARPGLAMGGPGAGSSIVGLGHSSWAEVRAAMDGLTGMPEDRLKDLVPGVLDCVARLNGDGTPLHIEEALGELKTRTGHTVTALRAALREKQQAVRRAARDVAKRARGELLTDTNDYTYVEAQARLYNHRSGQWVLPMAYAAMQGLDAAELDLSQFHRKHHDVTFVPAMPWRSGFKASDWYSVADPPTGLEAMNLWTQPRSHPPCWDARVSDEAIAPWLGLLPLAGVEDGVAQELYDVLAFKCQHPEVKVNRMVLLGGGQGSGKSTLLLPLACALGEAHVLYSAHNVLDSDFDPDVSRAVVMVCEEMASQSTHRLSDGRRMYNKMKPYAAAPPSRLSVTLKGQNAMQVPNLLLAVGTTNHRDAVQMESDDRRMFMVWMATCETHRDEAWGRWLYEWMAGVQWATGGEGAPVEYTGEQLVAGWLLQRDVRGFNPGSRPTRTWWWHEAVEDSRPPIEQAIGEAMSGLRAVRQVVSMLDLRSAVVVVMRDNGFDEPSTKAVSTAVRRLGHTVVRARARGAKGSIGGATLVLLDESLAGRTHSALLELAG